MAAKPVILDKPMNMNELLSEKGFTFQTTFDDNANDDDSDDYDDIGSEFTGQLDQVNLKDEDLYEYDQVPFEDIEPLMTALDEQGMVKKRIFREGKGDVIPKNCKVTYHYKAYQELEALAFDSTYTRRKPEISRIDNILYGLGVAITSMKIREKSQFLIKPEWAYGVNGIPPRIPPKATILFEVELLSFVPLTDNDQEDEEMRDSKDFTKNYQKALALCAEAKHLIAVEKKNKVAIRNYNHAINILSNVTVADDEQEKDYVTLLIRLYTNLAITHNHLDHWEKCCLNCKEIDKLCNTFYRTVDGRVYYNHSKALFGLGDLIGAEEMLRKAAKSSSYDRPDPHILALYKKIQEAKAKESKLEKDLAKAMFKKNGNK
ncbi:inactive peptidyl-prolyl cis-trans isomerase FKBP6 [Atheta coriaria]|uniref:inactive peptidyl-prolyl cis-trans isomerase FKBP6 n=1 Tax=Dalotia coriaria TaxID=877792 RepID=UPI0031F36217